MRKTEERHRDRGKSPDEAVFALNQDGVFQFINRVMAMGLDKNTEDVVGKTLWDVYPRPVADSHMTSVRRVVASGDSEIVESETELRGKRRRCITSLHPIKDRSGLIVFVLGITRCTRASRGTQRELERERDFVRFLMDTANSLIVCLDHRARITIFNDECERVTGYGRDEVIGKSWPELFLPAEVHHEGLKDFGAWVREHPKDTYEGPLRTRSGEIRTILWSNASLIPPDSSKMVAIAVGQDITERKRAEEALLASEHRYELATAAAKVGVWDWNLQTGEFFLDPSVKAVLGFGNDEIPNDLDTWVARVHPEDRQAVMEAAKAHLRGDTPEYVFEHRMLHKNGCYRWILVRGRAIRDEHGNAVRMVGTDTDITDRKQAESTLHHRLALEELVAVISRRFINVAAADLDNTITSALRSVGEFSGVDRSYVFQLSEDGALMSNTHEWCSEGIEPQIDNLKAIPTEKVRWWMSRLRRFEHVHLPRLSDLPPDEDFTRRALENQSIKSLICVPMAYLGRLVGFLGFDAVRTEVTWSEEDMVLLGMVGEIIVSALERKRAEMEVRRISQEKISQAKLMAGGFAHEMRNALFPARGLVDKLKELLSRSAPDAESVRKYLGMTETSLARAMEITTLISQYARLDSEYLPERVVLGAVVDEVLSANELRIRGQNIKVGVSGSGTLRVESNGRQLYSALNNLLINSLDALEDVRRPSVSVCWEQAGGVVNLTFSDNGCGIPECDLSRVFEVFYSTKPDRGTGIGLATVKKVIEMYGGLVVASSRPGQGTAFNVKLKAAEGSR